MSSCKLSSEQEKQLKKAAKIWAKVRQERLDKLMTAIGDQYSETFEILDGLEDERPPVLAGIVVEDLIMATCFVAMSLNETMCDYLLDEMRSSDVPDEKSVSMLEDLKDKLLQDISEIADARFADFLKESGLAKQKTVNEKTREEIEALLNADNSD